MSEWRTRYLTETMHNQKSLPISVLYWGLSPFSFLYGLVMRLRAWCYATGLKKSYRATVPVVSVGNLVAGGTGKTPMVDFLVRHAVSLGIDCAVVSRGYGGDYRQEVGTVRDAAGRLRMTPQECGDEPYLLAVRNPVVPVYVARRRALGVQAAEQDGAQLIFLDDGFQHLAVARDADIVLLDARAPLGNGRLIPAGTLREPSAALQRADLIVMTRSGGHESPALPIQGALVYSRHTPDRALRDLQGRIVDAGAWSGKSCLAFAGIANPEDFFQSLRDLGFGHVESIALADHQPYSPEVLNRLVRSCHNHDFLVTTEKDAVKLQEGLFPIPCLQQGVRLEFDDPEPLAELLGKVLERYGIVLNKGTLN